MALTSGSKILIDEVNDAVKAFSVSGKTVTFTRLDGTTGTFTTQDTNTTYSNMKAATADAAGKAGLVPAPAKGYQTRFLRGDGTWQLITGLSLPAGSVIAFAGNPSSAPSGFLLCNGAKVSRTTYSALFSAIGTLYGTGDGSTTFTLPNLANKFIMGHGTAGTSKSAGLPNITGHIANRDDVGHRDSWCDATGAFWGEGTSQNRWRGTSGGQGAEYAAFDASRSNSIYGASTTVQPPALTMRYYIKY